MNQKIAITIVGYGNVGKGVHHAVLNSPDMQIAGIISRNPDRTMAQLVAPISVSIVHDSDEAAIRLLERQTSVAILCGGSKEDLPVQGPRFARYFHTVDSFDTHADIPGYFLRMNAEAQMSGRVSVISAGWDPGTFSLERVLGDSFLPGSKKYTFWGPGVSQGHSDALRRVPGVADAIQYTLPVEEALKRVRDGENPELTTRQKHTRDCYVALKPGADAETVRKAIVDMPKYFADYDTKVTFESADQIAERKQKMSHGGFVMTSGQTGDGNKARIEYENQWGSNPEATGNILVACARAANRLYLDGKTGAFTMLDIPPSYYSPRSRVELLKDFM